MKKLLALTLALLLLVSAISIATASSPDGVKLGLGHSIAINRSTSATADKAGAVASNIVFCAANFDANGVILAIHFDLAETSVPFDATGAITADLTQAQPTVRDLGDKFGMKAASPIGLEMYQQLNGLEKWAVGKNVNDVLKMQVTSDGKTADTDLISTTTISIGGFLTALQSAYADATSTTR